MVVELRRVVRRCLLQQGWVRQERAAAPEGEQPSFLAALEQRILEVEYLVTAVEQLGQRNGDHGDVQGHWLRLGDAHTILWSCCLSDLVQREAMDLVVARLIVLSFLKVDVDLAIGCVADDFIAAEHGFVAELGRIYQVA